MNRHVARPWEDEAALPVLRSIGLDSNLGVPVRHAVELLNQLRPAAEARPTAGGR